ncbi:MAG: CoB--CoM heterodisulfide reductase iron-sulfur subunit A family protein [Bacteroidales bacterium]|nr:CoB--CoM heterodisulfide reductase iron-sulfur subunit A family protein [Bacteroidales bacterium]
MKQKIGVYICHCGGNISDYVDVDKVKDVLAKEDGVYVSKTTIFACADSNQKEMVADIKANELDAVVVASCSPKLHQITFQAVTERAGLNKYNYVHANIREQVSWPHSDNKIGATEKAIQIVRSSVAKVRLSQAIEPIEIDTQQAVLVLGAGIAGMKAAISLAKMGTQVYLAEREHFIGGRIAHWDVLCGTEETGKELVTRLYTDVIANKNITLYTGAEMVSSGGSKGNFNVQLKLKPRYVADVCDDKENIKKAIEVCPVEVPDEFNFGITKRKAIYHNFPSEYPQAAVINMDDCTRCGECEKVCDKIDLSQKEETVEVKVGSVLVATGFDSYTPGEGEFGYQAIDNVITLSQYKRLLAISNGELKWNGKKIENVAYIYCVGSRQVEGENKYCSRYCCTATINTALRSNDKFKNLNHFHFTRGMRTYGKQEVFYHEASKQGHVFFQSYGDDPTKVENKNGKTIVKINDILTNRKELEVEADLVVLVTGMVPRAHNTIGDILKIPKGRDKFYNEIHMKLRPVETVIDGVTIAGACQGPKNIVESINSALSASIKSYSFVSSDKLSVEPIVAKIDENLCQYCDACTTACPFDAISKVKSGSKDVALINHTVCKGCGMCLPVCPTNAIQLITFSDDEVENMINVLANEL